MPAVDPRLLAQSRVVRVLLVRSAALGVATAALVIAQAWLLARLISASFQDGAGLAELRDPLLILLGVVLARAVLAWWVEVMAQRAGTRVKSELRMDLLRHVVGLGPGWLTRHRTADLEALSTRGLDGLDGYFTRYLPQLVLAVVVPTAVVAAVVTQDVVAAAIIAGTVPLIPLLMWVVGAGTRALTARRLATLQRLGGHFLDSVAGLTTLKVFGQARAQADLVRRTTDEFRRETMGTLRVAFLSALVLELLASLSVAVVAVAVGTTSSAAGWTSRRACSCSSSHPRPTCRCGRSARAFTRARTGWRPRTRRSRFCAARSLPALTVPAYRATRPWTCDWTRSA
ncbi:MAG: ABC transporter transmembrane domain-containing protein [Kribbellaceae bacterium]